MRRHVHLCAAATALLVLLGCGELHNDRLRVTVVKGQVVGADLTDGVALVQEHADLGVPLGADGRFELRGVPAGTMHLYVMAPNTGGVIKEVVARAGEVADLGEIALSASSGLSVAVAIAGGYSASQGMVTVRGTHFDPQQIGADERALFTPLPAGCYDIQTSVPLVGSQWAQACVEPGVTATVWIRFAPANGGTTFGGGCGQIGCVVDRQCLADGRCVECTQNLDCDNGQVCDGQGRCVGCTQTLDCGPGLTCDAESNECIEFLPACRLCASDDECGDGKCDSHAGEPPACLYPCGSGGTCADRGFVCESGRCVPDPAAYRGCQAIRQMGMVCSNDQMCVEQGLVDGACIATECTTRCTSSGICPATYACWTMNSQQVCALKD
ncbi:MAG TPA: carboxypeptidase-like regulatory domain-containing protein [Myxococcaceae bacterium]|nr:carboxypeptidase-like regulatory domain-containing protein [Myxococcaceae bacterium]